MAWVTKNEVQNNNPSLQRQKVDANIDNLITEGEAIVLSDISGLKNDYQLENYDPAPNTLKRLAIYKIRELAYIYHYDSVPENSEVQYYQNEYMKLIDRIEQRLAKIDNSNDTEERKVVFV